MKKILISLSCSLILSSCDSKSNLVKNITSIDTKNTDAFIIKMLDERFTFADKNKDKKLVFSEFKMLESEHEDVMKKMFNSVDKNKDSIVTYEEFSLGVSLFPNLVISNITPFITLQLITHLLFK